MIDNILNHFKYPTTWVSLIAGASGLFGFVITPELGEEIAKLAVAGVSFVMFFYSDSDVKGK